VKLAAGNYDAYIAIAGKDVSIHGQAATLTALGNNTALDIQGGAHVRVLGLTIANQGGDSAMYCNASDATFDMSAIAVTSDGGVMTTQDCTGSISGSRLRSTSLSTPNIFAAAGNVTIDRSVIDGGNGVLSEGGTTLVRIKNSIFVNQLGSYGPFSGSALFANNGPGSMFVSFSTVIGSVVKCAQASPKCAGGTGAGSCIDNSIIFAPALNGTADVVQGNCKVDYSVVTPQSTQLTGANNMLGAQPMFEDQNTADFHLQATSPAVDAADPAATDAYDYDGTVRPQGTRRDMGAFEYK
jgi:hypothetical protein